MKVLLVGLFALGSISAFSAVSFHIKGKPAEALYKATKFTSVDTSNGVKTKLLLDANSKIVLMCTFDSALEKESKLDSSIDPNLIYFCLVDQGRPGLDDEGMIIKN